MIKRWICALMAVLMLAGGCATAEMPAAEHAARITVQGTATVMAEPDMVVVTANASVVSQSVAKAQEQMSVIIGSATEGLLALGLAGDDIVTRDYSYFPRYDYESNTVTGYDANHTLEITCRDVSKLDSVIGVITDSGFTQIYSVSHGLSNYSEIYNRALEMAVASAESKALILAQASGKTITGLASLSENGGTYASSAMDMVRMESKVGGTGIRAGSVSVSAGVTAVYEVQ